MHEDLKQNLITLAILKTNRNESNSELWLLMKYSRVFSKGFLLYIVNKVKQALNIFMTRENLC